MPIRLLIALVLLIATPLLLLGWNLGVAMEAGQAEARRSVEGILSRRLTEATARIQRQLRSYQNTYLTDCIASNNAKGNSRLVQWVGQLRRQDPLVQTAFLLDARQQLVSPAPPPQMDARRVREYLGINEMANGRPRGEAEATAIQRNGHVARWMPWYREQGLQLVLWIEIPDGSSVGILLNRSAWLAELIGSLPDSPLATTPPAEAQSKNGSMTVGPAGEKDASLLSSGSGVTSRAVLADAGDTVIYHWGEQAEYAPTLATNESDKAVWYRWVAVPLPAPLAAWELRYEGNSPLAAQGSTATPTMIALSGLGVLLIALGIYVTTSLRRQMMLAQQQVSFAGQVSHELRTPLTNLRLYAEMAEADLGKLPTTPAQQSLQRRLEVIHHETQRLGRLCAGILELVRRPHGQRQIRWEAINPDDCLRELICQFAPALEQQQVTIETDLQTDASIWLDRETLETVLVNLLSNVEKYASEGQWLKIRSWFSEQRLYVRVADRGPGIPRRFRSRIFRPFFRIDSSLQAPGGTGIGLSIAKQRAESVGGKLWLCVGAGEKPDKTSPAAGKGATFELQLPFQREQP